MRTRLFAQRQHAQRLAVWRRFVKRLLPVPLALLVAACFQFDDPVIPERRAPALLQAGVRVLGPTTLQVDGVLWPGRDADGSLRILQVPQLHVSEFTIEPVGVNERGELNYFATRPIGEERGLSFEIQAPAVRGATTPLPVRWHALHRVGPDTLRLPAGSDIVLRVDTVPLPSQPAERTRQWFAEVRGGGAVFRLSADGAPPASLRIPAEWIVAAPGTTASVSLIYMQNTVLRAADDTYNASITLDSRLQWTITFEAP